MVQKHLGHKGHMLCPGCSGASASRALQDTAGREADAAADILRLILPAPFLFPKKKISLEIFVEGKAYLGPGKK